MTIRFLRNVTVDMEDWQVFCECCGPERDGWRPAGFQEGEECDPAAYQASIQLDQLQFGVDYTIIAYP
jgi:hypothetical protein